MGGGLSATPLYVWRSMRLLIVIVFISSVLFCQNKSEKYVYATLEKGLPTEITLKWQNTFYSSINVGGYYKSLFVVSHDSFKTSEKCFLFLVDEDGFSFTAISFEKKDENVFMARISLNNKYEDKLSPLKLVLNLNQKSFKYRWENKDESKYEVPTVIEEYGLKAGKLFPLIVVETPKGKWSNNQKDKIIVINWWATSCLPCVEEMPGLNELVNKIPKDKVEFIAIVWDKENLSRFLTKHQFNYKHGFGNKNMSQLFGETFPRHIIVNKDGVILFNKLGGYKDINLELEKVINKYL
jgi:thiol-disulfide isomerase/thioredoxin